MAPLNAAIPDRDIDLLLVTGAGASRAFGINDSALPLMGDWSTTLVRRLREGGPGFLEATGLSDGISPEEFERRLGNYLRAVEGFHRTKSLLGPLALIDQSRSPFQADGWEHWHDQNAIYLESVTRVIYGSLYEMFGRPPFDQRGLVGAYGELLRALRITDPRGARWVYATTNYDDLGEVAIHGVGARPDSGEIFSDQSTSEPTIDVENLIGGIPRYVPVLHLHGKVGWFLRDAGPKHLPGVEQYEDRWGTPIIMLPDLEKSYANFEVITPVWAEFAQAVRRARRVFVLGHSLHDRTLLQTLRDNVDRPDRIAATYLSVERERGEPAGDEAAEVRNRIGVELEGANRIPMRFAPGVDLASKDLVRWVEADF